MRINIPRVMQPYFFELFNRSNRVKRTEMHKVCEFLSMQTEFPELAERAKNLKDYDGLKAEILMRQLMELLFTQVVTWTHKDPATCTFGYMVRTEPTLIEYDGRETEVIELGGWVNDRHHYKRRASHPQEWFGVKDIPDLLQAIECKVGIPEEMYTGLDTKGNNMVL